MNPIVVGCAVIAAFATAAFFGFWAMVIVAARADDPMELRSYDEPEDGYPPYGV